MSALDIRLSSEETLLPLLLCLAEWKGDGSIASNQLQDLGIRCEISGQNTIRLTRPASRKDDLRYDPLPALDEIAHMVVPFVAEPCSLTVTSGPTGARTKVSIRLRPNHLKFTKTGPRGGRAMHEKTIAFNRKRGVTLDRAFVANALVESSPRWSGEGGPMALDAISCLQVLDKLNEAPLGDVLRLQSLGRRVAAGEAYQSLHRIAVDLCHPGRVAALLKNLTKADLAAGAAYLALPHELWDAIVERSVQFATEQEVATPRKAFERALSLGFSSYLQHERLTPQEVTSLRQALEAALPQQQSAPALPEPSDSTRDFYPGWNSYWTWRGTRAAYDLEWRCFAEALLAIDARDPQRAAEIIGRIHYGYDEASSTWPDADWIALIRRATDLGLNMGEAPSGWHDRIWRFATRSGYKETTQFPDPMTTPFVSELLWPVVTMQSEWWV